MTRTDSPGGVIFDIQRWCTEDGPGIRTTIFFKGCPLRCVWCCNPESWSALPQLGLFPERCRGCGDCAAVCPKGVARPLEEGTLPPESCAACGSCVAACPHGARQLFGKWMPAEEILAAVERDRVFHRRSGGGVTFSGGEATCQPRLLRHLAEQLRRSGSHLALETCGHFSWPDNEHALGMMDLVYFDLKHMDSPTHEQLTGVGNALILRNASRLAAAGIPLIIRLPLIPGLNDSDDNLEQTARFVRDHLGPSIPIEVLPYHVLGRHKFGSIGERCACRELVAPSSERVARVREKLTAAGATMVA